MSNITISNIKNDEEFSIAFSREEFKDFVLSLVSSPHVSTKKFARGFDLNKGNLRELLNKIDHFLKTNHHSVPIDSKVDVIFDDGSSISFDSSEQFFAQNKYFSAPITKLSIRSSFLIPFLREDIRSMEKQTLRLAFSADQSGELRVDISSTEISWPDGLFNLIRSEFEGLAKASGGLSWDDCPWYFGFGRGLWSTSDDDITSFYLGRGLSLILLPLMLISLSLGVLSRSFKTDAIVFDQATGGFTRISDVYAGNVDWREIADDYFLTSQLIEAGLVAPPRSYMEELIASLSQVSFAFWGFSILVMVYFLLNFEYVRRYRTFTKGRIVATEEYLPPRSLEPSVWFTVLTALGFGVAANSVFGFFATVVSYFPSL